MAVSKDIGMESYCGKLGAELLGLKYRVNELMSGIELMAGPDNKLLRTHLTHLHDIEKTIEWKMDILMKACPADWKDVYCDLESDVSVKTPDVTGPEVISGGFVGG